MCDHCGCRQFPAIAELSAEHEEILGVAWALSEALRSSAPDVTALRQKLLSMLEVHVRAEETALYPLLVVCGDLTADRSDALEAEHETLRVAIIGGAFDRRAFYELAAHIEEEELELFPAAMFAFDDDDWADLEVTDRFLLRKQTGEFV